MGNGVMFGLLAEPTGWRDVDGRGFSMGLTALVVKPWLGSAARSVDSVTCSMDCFQVLC
jgi:hypothetical protein